MIPYRDGPLNPLCPLHTLFATLATPRQSKEAAPKSAQLCARVHVRPCAFVRPSQIEATSVCVRLCVRQVHKCTCVCACLEEEEAREELKYV